MTSKERMDELQQEMLRLKLRFSDKIFQLSVELDQDAALIRQKIEKIEKEENKEDNTVK